MNTFGGTGVALVTPFDAQQKIDENSLERLVESVIEGGADYLVALGTTSEAATLSAEERERVLELILKKNAGRLPVMAGIGGNNTAEVLKQVRNFAYAKECQAILSVTPYYNKPSQEGLYRHYREISENSPLPVVLYNVPGRTGINMAAQTVIRLAQDCPNIVAVKEAGGNFTQVSEILKEKPADFTVISGDDGLTVPLMSIGVSGVISVIANAFPAEFSAMVRLAQSGRFGEAAAIHLQLSGLFHALFAEGNPAGIKTALYIRNRIACGSLRLPLTPVSSGLHETLRRLIAELKF